MGLPLSWVEYWHERAVIFYKRQKRASEHERAISDYTSSIKALR